MLQYDHARISKLKTNKKYGQSILFGEHREVCFFCPAHLLLHRLTTACTAMMVALSDHVGIATFLFWIN